MGLAGGGEKNDSNYDAKIQALVRQKVDQPLKLFVGGDGFLEHITDLLYDIVGRNNF